MAKKIEYKLVDENTQDRGKLIYEQDPDMKPVTFILLTDSKDLRKKVTDYFKRKRKFYIPESQVIDDYRQDIARPIDELTYFEISITELSSRIEVDFFE